MDQSDIIILTIVIIVIASNLWLGFWINSILKRFRGWFSSLWKRKT